MDPNFVSRRNGTGAQNEFLLQGSILDESRDALLHKLRGFCDHSDIPPQPFQDHEMVFAIKLTSGQMNSLRLRRSIDHPDNPWNLRYLGHHDTDRNRLALARSCVDCNTTSNIAQFLLEMGFRLDFEFILRGHMFRKGRMKILVYKMYRINGGSGIVNGTINPNLILSEITEPLTQSHIVELSVIAPSHQSLIADDMKQFSDLLKPLVVLENIDMRKLNT